MVQRPKALLYLQYPHARGYFEVGATFPEITPLGASGLAGMLENLTADPGKLQSTHTHTHSSGFA